MKETKYVYVDLIAVKELDISIAEYMLCDIICKLQAVNGYSYASNTYYAKCLNMSDRGVRKMIKRLVDKNIISIGSKKIGQTNKMCVRDIWHSTVVFKKEQSAEGSALSSDTPEQSAYNNIINNNININTNTKQIAKATAKSTKVVEFKNDSKDINALLLYFYSKLVPAEQSSRRFSTSNRKAIDSLLSTYGLADVRETINKARELLGKPYKPQVQSPLTLLAKYEQIKADKQAIKHQPTKKI